MRLTEEQPPFSVDLYDVGVWIEIAGPFKTMEEAARLASYVVRRDWRAAGQERNVRVLDGDGREL